jgi:hypothetical protein
MPQFLRENGNVQFKNIMGTVYQKNHFTLKTTIQNKS